MTKEKEMRLHSIFNIVLTVFIILTGLCFMAGCLRIYFNVTFDGPIPMFYPDQEYSREIVAETFSFIAIPVYVTIATALVGFVWEFISPVKTKKEKMNKDNKNLAKRLWRKKNAAGYDRGDKAVSPIYNIKMKRTVHKWALAATWAVFTVLFLAYGAASANYTDDINNSVLNAFLVLISCIAVPFVYSVCFINIAEKSYAKEVELLKKLPDAREDEIEKVSAKKENKVLFAVRIAVILVAAVALICAGIYFGGYEDVLTKAVNICTECIGLG